MNNNITYISDFFLEDIVGGGELNDNELIKILESKEYEVSKIRSINVNLKFLEQRRNSFFIISNFINLKQNCRDWLRNNASYIIYEHDHKYLRSRNPATYKNFEATDSDIRNFFFYKNAQKVVCQSKLHRQIIFKNLNIDNIISVGGNLWSEESLQVLKTLSESEKHNKCSIIGSSIPHKNTNKAIAYCEKQGFEYEVVSDKDYIQFLNKLGRNNTLVFFPGTPETFSRVIVEARMMGMSIKTNGLVGATSEDWFSNVKGVDLINLMNSKRQEILKILENEIKSVKPKRRTKKISILSSFYKGEEYLEGFLENMTKQTIFNDCELVLVDTGSPGNEKQIVQNYTKKHDNIIYLRFEERKTSTEGYNIALKNSTADLVTMACIDDRRSLTCLEDLLSEIELNQNVDLVYGDCVVSTTKNETLEETKSKTLLDHSNFEFSRENMVKCLPGPMPLWKKTIHEKVGFLDKQKYSFADDWDLWLRAVDSGSIFKKVNKIVGLYLQGGRSQQENNLVQRKEEATLFFQYKHLFGKNYQKFEPYFKQFVR